ncbi:hypothetical protein A2376_00230 [Candidatus Woesebacteria bacterium RIFOXYB1_FULL_47_31]|uniref:Uncharacterized protein n=1 Tax=Candidatus Woesebacteria bacterium RIFOXYB1_FULL_47_31 TaxID=1802542 RepID=A0A1F8D0K8_9BACT|nr:MAG: hypothetical protein A2376_00230 [Candidatus Woesebacteria bacterium RIFOXYB1_FULL_47_31]
MTSSIGPTAFTEANTFGLEVGVGEGDSLGVGDGEASGLGVGETSGLADGEGLGVGDGEGLREVNNPLILSMNLPCPSPIILMSSA